MKQAEDLVYIRLARADVATANIAHGSEFQWSGSIWCGEKSWPSIPQDRIGTLYQRPTSRRGQGVGTACQVSPARDSTAGKARLPDKFVRWELFLRHLKTESFTNWYLFDEAPTSHATPRSIGCNKAFWLAMRMSFGVPEGRVITGVAFRRVRPYPCNMTSRLLSKGSPRDTTCWATMFRTARRAFTVNGPP